MKVKALIGILLMFFCYSSLQARTNRPDRIAEINNRYQTVIWGEEIDHVKYKQIAAAFILGTVIAGPAVGVQAATILVKFFVFETGAVFVDELSFNVIKDLLAGGVKKIGNNVYYGGFQTFNHWSIEGGAIIKAKVPHPNTFQPYIAVNKVKGSPPADGINTRHNLLLSFMDGVDAAVSWTNGKAYFFKGPYYIRVNDKPWPDNTVDEGYPKRITNSRWDGWENAGFHNGIDAAVSWGDVAYFFKGNQYIKVARRPHPNNKMYDNYPKTINNKRWDGWEDAGFHTGITAAVSWGDVAYFFKGNQYIKVDRKPYPDNKMWNGSPKAINNKRWYRWVDAGFGGNIDSAVSWSNGKSYFTRGRNYIRVVRKPYPENKMDPGYPKDNHLLIHN